MFVSFMKISACWLLHRLIKFDKICWEKRPAIPRPNLRTSFWRRDLKNTQPHLKASDYRSYFAKTILFENCSCFSKIPFSISVESPRIFQCLISIPAGHRVRQIDSNLPRWFFWSALPSLVISMTGRSERSARALRDGANVVREAIGNWFCVRICYMFLISKCRGDWDLGLFTTSVLAFGTRMHDGKIRGKKTCFDAGKIGFCHCAAVLQAQVLKLCTDLDLSLLYNLISGTYSKFARKINFLALGVYCPAGQSAFRRSRPTEIGWGNRIFEISRRLIAQNPQDPTPP